MNYKTRSRLYLAILAFCFVAFAALAQVTSTNLQPELTGADKTIADTVAKFSYWQGMLLPITMVLVYAVKKWVAFIPDKFLPWTAPIIGGLLDMAAQKFGLWTGNPAVGAAMGGLATWAHQVFNQMSEPKETTDVPAGDNEGSAPKIGLWFLIACLSFGTVGLTGCTIFGNTPRTAEAQKFDTYQTVYRGAREAYKTFKRECFAGKVTAENEAKGDKAWNEFRVAYVSAFKIGMDDALAPENVIALKNQLVRLLLTL